MASSVVFATPTFSHTFCIDYVRSMIRTVGACWNAGIQTNFIYRGGDAYLEKVRNKLAYAFLKNHPDVDNLFFLDDDVGWDPEKAVQYIQRPEDIILGCYPPRTDKLDWPGVSVLVGDDGKLIENGGLIALQNGPTGFMRIKRHVLEGMLKLKGEEGEVPWFRDMEANGEEAWYPRLFTMGVGSDGWYWSEDVAFCRNAIACGYQVWCDPTCEFTHRGGKTWGPTSLKDSLPTFRKRAKAFHKKQLAEQKTSQAA